MGNTRLHWAAAAACAGLAAMGAAARADGTSPGQGSALAAACAPFASERAEGAGAPSESQASGLRSWMGLGPREKDPFDGFSRPVTNLSFHHPFIWNEIRPVYVDHRFPEHSITGGGRLRAYACQIHARITDDVQFTAYKDGYVDFEPDAALAEDTGFADLAFGFKMRVWQDTSVPAIFTVGLGYETTTGDEDVLEGKAPLFDLFGSYARKFGPVNFIGTAGVLIPQDADDAVRVLHWHLHADVAVLDTLSALVEINTFTYLSDAERNAGLGPAVPLGFEGFDYTNLGADDVQGNSVVTMGIGFRWFVNDDVSLGAAWEFPLTEREDLVDGRLTMDLVLRF